MPSRWVGRLSSGSPPKLLRKLGYYALHITTKTPRDDPTDFLHHRHRCLGMESTSTRTFCHTKICQLRRPAQPVPAKTFRDWRLPLLPHPTNGNRHSQPAPWTTPSQRSEDFLDTEGEYQGGEIPVANPDAPFGDRRLPLLHPPTSGNRHSQPAPWLMPSLLSEDFTNKEGEDQGGKTPAADHRRESHFRVQSRFSDTCPQACHVINQNFQGITGGEKLKKTI